MADESTPPDEYKELTVADRIEKINRICDLYYDVDPDVPTQAVQDMMSDILHVLAKYKRNLSECFDWTIVNFHEERDLEGIEQYPFVDCYPDDEELEASLPVAEPEKLWKLAFTDRRTSPGPVFISGLYTSQEKMHVAKQAAVADLNEFTHIHSFGSRWVSGRKGMDIDQPVDMNAIKKVFPIVYETI